jgi:hypothetical protein
MTVRRGCVQKDNGVCVCVQCVHFKIKKVGTKNVYSSSFFYRLVSGRKTNL